MKLHVDRLGTGPDLVLLHGWGLHGGAWSDALPALTPRFRVHVVDLPGHGRSAEVPAGSFDAAVARVREAIPRGAAVCGWSLGGLFAQRLAVDDAHARAPVLVSTTPCFTVRDDWPHAMQPATLDGFARGLHVDRERTLRDFVHLNALHGRHARDAVRALTAELACHPASVAALEGSLQWLRDTDLRAAVPRLPPGTLVIHGARDALTPIEAGRWISAQAPHARLVEIEDAGHLPFFTHRDAFAAALESVRG